MSTTIDDRVATLKAERERQRAYRLDVEQRRNKADADRHAALDAGDVKSAEGHAATVAALTTELARLEPDISALDDAYQRAEAERIRRDQEKDLADQRALAAASRLGLQQDVDRAHELLSEVAGEIRKLVEAERKAARDARELHVLEVRLGLCEHDQNLHVPRDLSRWADKNPVVYALANHGVTR